MTASDHDAVSELLGAYALDAVDGDEATMVRAHVDGCPRCDAELQSHQQAVGLLANSGGDAPEHIWGRIEARLERPAGIVEHPAPELALSLVGGELSAPRSTAGRVRRRRIPRRPIGARLLGGAAAAAAVAVIAVLGVDVGHLDQRVSQLEAAGRQGGLVRAAQGALADPRAELVSLRAPQGTGSSLAEIVILPSGSAFVVDSHLPALSPDRTYQLWGDVGGQVISLGLLGSHPSDVAFRVNPTAHVSAFAVTAERAGGVVHSAHVPVAESSTTS